MDDLTILVNTCDKHQESWSPFFTLLNKYWQNISYPIVLNTETLNFSYEGLNIEAINTPVSVSWSERQLKVLNKIHTPFVLVFLEDFFIESPVNTYELNRCLNFMRKNPSAGCVNFRNTPQGTCECEELKGFALIGQKAKYRVNCQVALWRTNVLKELLRKHESAWEFERWGSYRSRFTNYRFYSIMKNYELPFDYDWGKPIYRGHWNLHSINRIQQKCNIEISTGTLPVIKNMNSLPKPDKTPRNLKYFLHRSKSLF